MLLRSFLFGIRMTLVVNISILQRFCRISGFQSMNIFSNSNVLHSGEIKIKSTMAYLVFCLTHLNGCVPIFSPPYIPQLFTSHYVSSLDVSQPDIPQSLCSPVPIFHRPFVPREPVPILPRTVPSTYLPQRVSPVQSFPGPDVPQVPVFTKMFPVPVLVTRVPRSLGQSSLSPFIVYSPFVPQRCPVVTKVPRPCIPKPQCSREVFSRSLCSPKIATRYD